MGTRQLPTDGIPAQGAHVQPIPATAAPPAGAPTWRPSATVAATALSIAVLIAVGSTVAAELPQAAGHALSHLVVGLPVAGLLLAVLRRWPPAPAVRPGRLGRRLVAVGLAGVVGGQLLEVAGARVDEPSALAVEEVAHTAGMIVTTLSLPLLVAGTVASLVAAARRGAVSWWVVVVVTLGAVALVGVMSIGAPDGS